MTEWVRGLVIPDIAQIHLMFAKVLRDATELETLLRRTPSATAAAATLAELRRAYVDFNDNLQAIAAETAIEAIRDIRARLAQTQVRPDTRTSPHLRDLIYCAPITAGLSVATGMVGIGRVSTLNRAINANSPGYGTYWRAQEYGTGGGEVPSQLGRVLLGVFVGPGGANPSAPAAQYAGGGGPHPIFLSAGRAGGGAAGVTRFIKRIGDTPTNMVRALDSGTPGWGTIGHEIQARGFLRYGADAATVRWRERIAALQTRVVDEVVAISAP